MFRASQQEPNYPVSSPMLDGLCRIQQPYPGTLCIDPRQYEAVTDSRGLLSTCNSLGLLADTFGRAKRM